MRSRLTTVKRASLAVLGALLSLASATGADTLRIRTEGSSRPLVTLYGDGRVIKRCIGGCTTEVERGRYRVVMDATPGTYAYEEVIKVNGATDVWVEPGQKGTRRALIVMGWTSIGVSVPLFLVASMFEMKGNVETGERGHVGGLTITSLTLFVGGLLCAGAATAFKPNITFGPHTAAAVVPTTGGALAFGTVSF